MITKPLWSRQQPRVENVSSFYTSEFPSLKIYTQFHNKWTSDENVSLLLQRWYKGHKTAQIMNLGSKHWSSPTVRDCPVCIYAY